MKMIIDNDNACKRFCLTRRTKIFWELKQNKRFYSLEKKNVSDVTFLAFYKHKINQS